MAEGMRDFLTAWKGFRTEAEEYMELDDERLLVLFRLSGRGKTSGLALEEIRPTGAHLFRIRGDKVAKLVVYFDRENALADLGLKE
jgi:hypothetical protein